MPVPFQRQTVDGQRAAEAPLPEFSPENSVALPGVHDGRRTVLRLPYAMLCKSLLALGVTQSGKSNLLFRILADLRARMGPEDCVVIFDSKRDFVREFYRPGDTILGAEFPGLPFAHWNVYRDLTIDGFDDDALERSAAAVCKRLFAGHQNAQQPFFSNAAQRLLQAFFIASAKDMAAHPKEASRYTNRLVRGYFSSAGPAAYEHLFTRCKNAGELRSYLGDFRSNQALGVLGELQSPLAQNFSGPWGSAGTFGVRDFVRGRGGRALFLCYDLSSGGAQDEMYGLMLDLAIRELLSDSRPGRVSFFLDELSLLGGAPPDMLKLAVNYGVTQGLGGVFAGAQSFAQLRELYGPDGALTLCAGFDSLVSFRPNDEASREFIHSRTGEVTVLERTFASGAWQRSTGLAPVASDWELSRLAPGQALVALGPHPPFFFTFDPYGRT